MEVEQAENKNLRPEEPSRDSLHAQIVELASGELRGVRAWWLRRQMARNPVLRREFEETRQIWSDLKALRSVDPAKRPQWPALPFPKNPTVTVVGKMLDRRAFLSAYGGLLLAVTGIVLLREGLGRHIFSSPVLEGTATGRREILALDETGGVWPSDTPDGISRPHNQAGRIVYDGKDSAGKPLHWEIDGPFIGETRLLNARQELLERTSHFDSKYGGQTQAWVRVNGHVFLVKAIVGNYQPQRFTFKTRSGEILGYVELVPQATTERRANDRYSLARGIEDVFEGSCGGQDGVGHATGAFKPWQNGRPINKGEAKWKFTGVGEVRFRRSTGRVVSRGFASPNKKHTNSVPVLEWTNEGKVQTFRGYGTFRVPLPDGGVLTAEIVPWEKRWFFSGTQQ